MPFHKAKQGALIYLCAGNLERAGVRHAFTTRLGGVSTGPYASLNLDLSNKKRDEIIENYKIITGALEVTLKGAAMNRQVHGNTVRVASRREPGLFEQGRPEADGLITADEDLPLIVFTADCIPILLYDPVRRAAGAVHAGWRGTVQDIAGEAVRKMTENFGSNPSDILAAIGPGIGRCCFETGSDVPEAVRAALGDEGGRFIRPAGGKFFVDLKGVNGFLLHRAGVRDMEVSGDCTVCNPDTFWSHRVTAGVRGTQAAIISV